MKVETMFGSASGQIVLPVKGAYITAYLSGIRFFDESGQQVFPATGVATASYSHDSSEWHNFKIGGVQFPDGIVFNPYATGEIIRYLRLSFVGLSAYKFSAEFVLTQFPDGQIDPRVYTGLQGITTQPFTEANVKNGTQFESAIVGSIAAGQTIDTFFITGSKPVLIKASDIDVDGAGITATLYEGATYSGGTSVPVYNLSRRNAKATTVQIVAGASTLTTGIAVSPPIAIIGGNTPGTQSTPTGRIRGLDRELKENTIYLRRVVSNDVETQRISTYSTWYEGPTSLSIL